MKPAKTVDEYLDANEQWKPILEKLRHILKSTELEETIKWGAPAYTVNKKNVVGLAAFKSYTGMWFFQGALLHDPQKILINAQEGKTKALRQLRFNAVEDIDENMIKTFVEEAIANQKDSREMKAPAKKEFLIPVELQSAFENDEGLSISFESFSHSHKREYAEYIAEAKKPETRLRRLEKVIEMIKSRSGLNDKYR